MLDRNLDMAARERINLAHGRAFRSWPGCDGALHAIGIQVRARPAVEPFADSPKLVAYAQLTPSQTDARRNARRSLLRGSSTQAVTSTARIGVLKRRNSGIAGGSINRKLAVSLAFKCSNAA
jgi:hypothetical protein